KRALVDPSLLSTRERYAIVLQLYDRGRRFLAHEFDRVLVSEPIGALHGVVHVPAPVVLTHVAQRGADATLGRDGVAARWKELGNARRRQARFRQSQGCPQSCTTRPHDQHVVSVVCELVGAHDAPPKATFRMANTPATASKACTKVTITSVRVFIPLCM